MSVHAQRRANIDHRKRMFNGIVSDDFGLRCARVGARFQRKRLVKSIE
jgi:hypothetical protein